MSITDELREVAAKTECANGRCEKLYRGDLDHIADRIDAEHQKAEDKWRADNGDMWLKGYNVCHVELMEGHPVIAADLEKAGWVKLPKDADGEPIHIGDVITYEDNTKPKEVVALVPPSVVMVDDGPRYADMCRHYHEPTVEDVLRDLLNEAEHFHSLEEEQEAITEYATKLRLAGDAE